MTMADMNRIKGQWVCMMADAATGGVRPCMNVMIMNASSPAMTVQEGSLAPSVSYHFMFNLMDQDQTLGHCKI